MCIKEPLRQIAWLATITVLGHAQASYGQSLPDLSVGLRGRVRTTEGLGTEHVALLEVELIPPTSQGSANTNVALAEFEVDLEPAPGTEVPLDPLERDETAGPTDPSSVRRRGRDGPTKQQRLLNAVPFVMTPGFVHEAIEAALRTHGVMPTLARLDGLSSRAKSSALLPEVRFRAGRDVDQTLRLSPTSDDPYRYSQSGGVSFVLEGAVTWRLGKLVFTSEELSIERLRLAQARERQRITQVTLNELLVWHTAWRRTQALGDLGGNATEELFESTIRLDVLTGGWFSAHQPGQVAPTPARDAREREKPSRPSEQPSAALPAQPIRPGPDSRSALASASPSGNGPTGASAPRQRLADEEQPEAQRKVGPTQPPLLEGLALSR